MVLSIQLSYVYIRNLGSVRGSPVVAGNGAEYINSSPFEWGGRGNNYKRYLGAKQYFNVPLC